MNTARELRYRLLRLFPVAVVKQYFEPAGRTQYEMLEEITSGTTAEEINSFCFDNFGFTKQHIYLFQIGRFQIDRLDAVDDLLPTAELISKSKTAGTVRYSYLFSHTYDLAGIEESTRTFRELHLLFNQPIMIEITSASMKISLTIVEKNPESYLNGFKVYQAKRRMEDEDIVGSVMLRMADFSGAPPVPLDINRGIKHLWNHDLIDAVSIKYKKENSMAAEVMDEDMTFKNKYPEDFRKVLTAPLRKNTFRFLRDAEHYCDFVADPTAAILSFNKYPKEQNQISNVVSKILSHNA